MVMNMSTVPPQLESVAVARAPRRLSRTQILVLGVFVVPALLSVAFNSYGPLTEESAVRMAFATVAGQTIAILSVAVALAITIKRRPGGTSIAFFVLLSFVLVSGAVGTMSSAADTLVTRVHLVEVPASGNE
jgi:hypothetical protein